ncbi:MAG: hypothetical protein QM820_05955 [Minicystis sp.]
MHFEQDLGNRPNGAGGDGSITTCSLYDFPSSCSDGFECIDGLCLQASGTSCHLSDDGNDGCDAHSVCRQGSSGNRCYPVPDCPANGICPSTSTGDTCNDGTLTSKAAVCIPGRCLADADCPETEHCVRKKVSDVIGSCDSMFATYESNGAGAAWETLDGCALSPVALTGQKPEGATCSAPQECKPTCCSCSGGNSAILAAKCDLDPENPLTGTCASAADACVEAFFQGSDHVCTAP